MKASLVTVLLTVLFTCCLGQQPELKEEKIYYDTIHLTLPKMSKEDIATPHDYKHCIDLSHINYLVVINGIKYPNKNEQQLIAFIKSKRKDIIKQKVSIIIGPGTSYDKIVTILDIMKNERIEEFKLVSVDGKLPETSPMVVKSTKPFKKDIDLNDSTVLIISILDSSLETSLLNKKGFYKEVAELDKFIGDNKNNIDPYRIVVTGAGNLPFNVVEPVISLLRKHEYYDYHIIARN